MTTPHIVAIVDAFMAALNGAAPRVDRIRLRPIAAGITNAIAVWPLRVVVQESDFTGAPVETVSAIRVDCYAKAAPGVAPDLALAPLLSDVQQRLLTDPTMAGQVSWLALAGAEFDFDAEADDFACASLTFTVRHRPAGMPL